MERVEKKKEVSVNKSNSERSEPREPRLTACAVCLAGLGRLFGMMRFTATL